MAGRGRIASASATSFDGVTPDTAFENAMRVGAADSAATRVAGTLPPRAPVRTAALARRDATIDLSFRRPPERDESLRRSGAAARYRVDG